MSVTSVSDTYKSLGVYSGDSKAEEDSGNLGIDDFLKLMTTELENQDPLDPMDNSQMLSQIASFATVTGIDDLQTSFSSFADNMESSQSVQASALIGNSVLIESSVGNMTEDEGLSGQIYVSDDVTDLTVKIYSEEGELIKTLEIGEASGYTDFTWDGQNEEGEVMEPGPYQFVASGTIDGENTSFATATVGTVESIVLGSDEGIILNLTGIGSVLFSDALEIT
ncbi:MAG: flagellar hook capping protein [Gammaproteobacteria bacterium]|nr:MAG: flagellar hook capping protein [Gammaproteobacteria bacterium]